MSIIISVVIIGVLAIVMYLGWTYRRKIKDIIEVRKHWHAGDALIVD